MRVLPEIIWTCIVISICAALGAAGWMAVVGFVQLIGMLFVQITSC